MLIPSALSTESHVSINKCECLKIQNHSTQVLETKMEIISNKPTQFGNSPIWCKRRQSLFYTDFFGEIFSLYRFDDRNGKIHRAMIWPHRKNAAFIIPIVGCDHHFIVGCGDRKVVIVSWDGKSKYAFIVWTLFEVEQRSYFSGNIWHVAKVDPMGRFYGGTMRTQLCTNSSVPNGSFYYYTPYDGVWRICDNIRVSNGIEWSKKKAALYHVDACDFAIFSFNWNCSTGKISKFGVYENEPRRRFQFNVYFNSF